MGLIRSGNAPGVGGGGAAAFKTGSPNYRHKFGSAGASALQTRHTTNALVFPAARFHY
jgi:hypothetical protein